MFFSGMIVHIMLKKSLKKNQNNRKYKKQQQHKNKNKTRKNNKNKNRNNKNKRNKSQKGSGLLTDIAVPVALVAAREVIAPMINRRMGKNKNSKNKKLRGGFIRHHSTMPAQKDIQPSIMTVDEKINQSMD